MMINTDYAQYRAYAERLKEDSFIKEVVNGALTDGETEALLEQIDDIPKSIPNKQVTPPKWLTWRKSRL